MPVAARQRKVKRRPTTTARSSTSTVLGINGASPIRRTTHLLQRPASDWNMATPVCAFFHMDAGDRTLRFESICQVIGTRFGSISADFLHDLIRKLSPEDAQAKQAFEHLPRVACATERAWEQQSTSKVYCSRWWRARNSSTVLGGIGSVMARSRVTAVTSLATDAHV